MRRQRTERGFTIIELMIVISMVLILVSVAVPNYSKAIARSREAVLRENLFSLRSVIDQYTLDKQRAPQSLDDLVQSGYLREIPLDPCTHSRETWTVIEEDVMLSVDQTQPGIVDVRSGCPGTASDGTLYSEL